MADPVPFRPPAGVPIVGQPFHLKKIGIPVNAELTCSCGGPASETELTITMSQPAQCPCCLKTYTIVFNPTNNQIQVQVGLPPPETPAS